MPTKPGDLLAKIIDVSDLQGGRRDLPGILTRAAALVRDALDVSCAQAAVAFENTSLIACAQDNRTLIQTDPWEGPGTLGRGVLADEATVVWRSDEGGAGPSALDRIGCASPAAWAGAPLPLVHPARGMVAAISTDGTLDDEQVRLLELLGRGFGIAVSNLITFQKTEALALTDELTRLYNFRFLKTALRREMERASRYGQVFSIIMIDVDHLKRYNDEHGHLGGSELLRQLAAILSRSSRAIDLVAKYGGDEFMIILPQTRLDGALVMANRVRQAVAETVFPHCRAGDMTVSVGVASYPVHGDSVKGLVAAADQALFRAKRASRNCVMTAEAPGSGNDSVPDAA